MIDRKSLMDQIDRWYQDVCKMLIVVQAGLACCYNRFAIRKRETLTRKINEDWDKTHIEQSQSLKLSNFLSFPRKSFTQSSWATNVAAATCRWMAEIQSPRGRKDVLFLKMVELNHDVKETPDHVTQVAPTTPERFVPEMLEVVEEIEDSPRASSPAESMDLIASTPSKQSSRASSPCDDGETSTFEPFNNCCFSDDEDDDEDFELNEHKSLLILLARPWWRRNPSPCYLTTEKFRVTQISEAESESTNLAPSSSERPNENIEQVASTNDTNIPFYRTSESSASPTPVDPSALPEQAQFPTYKHLADRRCIIDAIKRASSVESLDQPKADHETMLVAETNKECEDEMNAARTGVESEELNMLPCQIPDYLADMQPGTSGLRTIELRILKLQEKEEEKRRKRETRAMQRALRMNPELWAPQIYKLFKEKMHDSDLSSVRKVLKSCGIDVSKKAELNYIN